MEIKRYLVDDVDFAFVCETWETRNSWGHKVVLFRNDVAYAEHKCRYYNRTWEMFRYQSCMLGVINDLQTELIESGITRYKKANNITRFKKGERDKVVEDVKHCHTYSVLQKLYNSIYIGNEKGGVL